MYHDQHYAASTTPPQPSQLYEDDASRAGPIPSERFDPSRRSTLEGIPPMATRPGSKRHRRPTQLIGGLRHVLSDKDEEEREMDRTRRQTGGRPPIWLSRTQDLILRLSMAAYILCIIVAIICIVNKEWILPYGAVVGDPSLRSLTIGLNPPGCIMPNDCTGSPTVQVDCRGQLKNDLGVSFILIIVGMACLGVSMYCIIRVGRYSIPFLCLTFSKGDSDRNPPDYPEHSWRRKKKYRRSPSFFAFVAFVLFLVGTILVLSTAKKQYTCQAALCEPGRCSYGAAFFCMWFVVAVTFVGALATFFMWRFPPKSLPVVVRLMEEQEMKLRAMEEAQAWEDYTERLAPLAVDLHRLALIDTLKCDNEELVSRLAFWNGYVAPTVQYGSDVNSPRSGDAYKALDEGDEDLPPPVDDDQDPGVPAPNGPPRPGSGPGTLPRQESTHRPISPHREALLAKENGLLAKKLKAMEDKWKKEALERKKFFNELQDMKGKIRVMCRCRPFRQEMEKGSLELKFVDEYTLQVPCKDRQYEFDYVFDTESRQEDVWAQCKDVAQSALDGYNVCIFAYGQTGSGKTYTMQGEESNPGVTPRMAKQVFDVCRKLQDTHDTSITCYMVELYRDDVNDLLLLSQKDAPKLDIKLDPNGIVVIKNVTTKKATSAAELLAIYEKGCSARHVRSHAMNEASSRSHLIFSVLIESVNRLSGKVVTGKLSLVDLAGSERLGKTKVGAAGREEATSINEGLFELGKVISELSSDKPSQFVNKRNSKLTLIMSDSLGGNAKTLMIVCVSPATYNVPETLNSLDFATRCKKITNVATKNEDSKQIAKIKGQYKAQIDELEREIDRLRKETGR